MTHDYYDGSAVISFREDDKWHSVAALQLSSMFSAELAHRVNGKHNEEEYHRDIWKRLRIFNNTISSPDYVLSSGEIAERQFEMRIISIPYKKVNPEIIIALLIRMSHSSLSVTNNAATEQLWELRDSIRALHEESSWSSVSTVDQLKGLLYPFKIDDGAEIARRIGRIHISGEIEKISRPNEMGFAVIKTKKNSNSGCEEDKHNSCQKTFPYSTLIQGWALLCRRLLQYPNAILIRLGIRPTRLTEDETNALDAENAWLHSVLNSNDIASENRNIFQKRLNMMVDGADRNRMALQDKAFEAHTEIYSDGPIAQGIIEHLGSSITQLASDSDFESGGFDWIFIRNNADLSKMVQSMTFNHQLGAMASMDCPRRRYLLNESEAITAFHLPFVTNEDFPGVKAITFKTLPDKRLGAYNGCLIGKTVDINGKKRDVTLQRLDRRQHLYVVGQTGSGKSTLLKHMMLSDIHNGEGACIIDPHGDLAEDIINNIPIERLQDVVYINPADFDYPIGLNMLEYRNEREKQFVVQEIISQMERLYDDKYTGSAAVTGPMFYHHLRMGLLYIMSGKDPVTFLDLYRFFSVPDYYKAFNINDINDDPILQAYHKSNAFNNFSKGNEFPFSWYLISKFDNFLGDPMIRNIICQEKTTINFDEIMNNGKILVVNLAKGSLGEINSRFLGMLIISKIQLAAMRRSSFPVTQRKDFYLYIDEFHNLATKNLSTILSEGRKFGLNLIMANQFIKQLPSYISQAITGNVGSMVIFRTGVEDAETLEQLTLPNFSRADIKNLPNWRGIALLQEDGTRKDPFSIMTYARSEIRSNGSGADIKNQSAEKYGKRVNEVIAEMKINEQWRMDLINMEHHGHIRKPTLESKEEHDMNYEPF